MSWLAIVLLTFVVAGLTLVLVTELGWWPRASRAERIEWEGEDVGEPEALHVRKRRWWGWGRRERIYPEPYRGPIHAPDEGYLRRVSRRLPMSAKLPGRDGDG